MTKGNGLMKAYSKLSKAERRELFAALMNEYKHYYDMGLSLDLSRGKPNSAQLDISLGLMSVDMSRNKCFSKTGFDCRNYGVLDGLPEMKAFFAEALGLRASDIIVGGNSSLQLMYGCLSRAMLFGVPGGEGPWSREEGLKWICVTPGYDRHFRITELLGFELISVPMTEGGPDMDAVEELVRDPKVKGIWCVPKYSNPTGNTYSDETVKRLATMKCAAPDFRIMWDNAYCVHDFGTDGDKLADIFSYADAAGNRDRIYYFSSTSKITFPGGGVAMMAMSENNRMSTLKYLGAETIGFDKLNQLRHLAFFGNADGMREHMLKLGGVIKEKFDITLSNLDTLRGLGIAEWTEPRGGYFVSLDVLPGCAKRVYELMKDAGVVLTPPGATHPYGYDPEDKTLRIAPTYPADVELYTATKILALSVKIAALEKLGV